MISDDLMEVEPRGLFSSNVFPVMYLISCRIRVNPVGRSTPAVSQPLPTGMPVLGHCLFTCLASFSEDQICSTVTVFSSFKIEPCQLCLVVIVFSSHTGQQ
jgi:hypothetical protein